MKRFAAFLKRSWLKAFILLIVIVSLSGLLLLAALLLTMFVIVLLSKSFNEARNVLDLNFPNLTQAIGLSLAYVVLTLAISLIFNITYYFLIDALSSLLIVSVILKLTIAKTQLPLRELLPFSIIPIRAVPPMAVSLMGSLILLNGLDNLFEKILPPPAFILEVFDQLFKSPGAVILLAVIAPIVEEIFDRGIILRGFLHHYKPAKAILLSSLIFALLHLNPWQFMAALPLGILFGWWYYRTNSLMPCIVGHALANGLSYLSVRCFLGEIKFSSQINFPWWIYLISLVFLVTGIFWSAKEFKPHADTTVTITELETLDAHKLDPL